MNIDSETYWMERIAELDGIIRLLKDDKADLASEVHKWRNVVTKKDARIHELEAQIIEFQKKEFHANEY